MKILFTGKLLDYKDYLPYSDTFIETGTAAGDGVQRAITAGFTNIVSIEASQQWFEYCRTKFAATEGVQIQFGYSTDVLGKILNWQIDEDPFPAVIYLDAHPAGPSSAGHQEWLDNPNGDANQHNIIQAELKIILNHRNDHVIIIDDVNGMADGCASVYMDMCLEVNPDYRFEFWDENLSGNQLYKNKILVCLPK